MELVDYRKNSSHKDIKQKTRDPWPANKKQDFLASQDVNDVHKQDINPNDFDYELKP